MAQRITDNDLIYRLTRLNTTLGFKKRYIKSKAEYKGSELEFYWAYGGVMLMDSNGHQYSPRLSKREMYDYLEGVSKGINLFKNRTKLKK